MMNLSYQMKERGRHPAGRYRSSMALKDTPGQVESDVRKYFRRDDKLRRQHRNGI